MPIEQSSFDNVLLEKEQSDDNDAEACDAPMLPKAKLAALTRKRREIEELLPGLPSNLPSVKSLFTEYLLKYEVLQEASQDQFTSWWESHKPSIDQFRSKIESLIYPMQASAGSVIDRGSRRSSRSSTSTYSARAKLAEQRAALLAQKNNLLSESKIAEEELIAEQQYKQRKLQLERERKKLDAKQVEEKLMHWESELDKLDDITNDEKSQQYISMDKLPEVRGAEARSKIEELTVRPKMVRELPVSSAEPALPELSVKPKKSSIFKSRMQQDYEGHNTKPQMATLNYDEGNFIAASARHKENAVVSSIDKNVSHSKPSKFVNFNPKVRGNSEDDSPHEFSTPSTGGTTPTSQYDDTFVSTSSNPNDRLITILEKQTVISEAMSQCQERTVLPKKELKIFDGSDITQFKSFWLNFERIIESKCANDGDKLVYLSQYTAGRAHKLVRSCNHYDSTRGFEKAKRLLVNEYGNEFKIANGYIEKMDNWPSIKSDDGDGLQDLSIFLLDCHHHLENMSSANQLQNPRQIMGVINKLPYRLRERWRRFTHGALKRGNICFEHLVEFVSEESAVLRQPLFGSIADKPNPKIKPMKPKKSLITSTDDSQQEQSGAVSSPTKVITSEKNCMYCQRKNHFISSCRTFKLLPHKDKNTFIKSSRLCFKCLRPSHMAKDCNNPSKCYTCGDQHPTVLHKFKTTPPNQDRQPEQPWLQAQPALPSAPPSSVSAEQRSITNTVNCSSKTNARNQKVKVAVPIVPALIKVTGTNKQVLINCALDSCSTDCWIEESLLNDLGVAGRDTKLNINTMAGNNEVKTRVVNNLQICDINGNFLTIIPVVYSKTSKTWPFDASDLITDADLYGTDFHHLPFNFTDSKISLLIGINVPSLFKPLQVYSNSENNEALAIQYPLGWTLSGHISRTTSKRLCNRISLDSDDLHEQVERYFSQDFFDPTCDKDMSQNDRKWLDIVQNSITKNDEGFYEIDLPLKTDDICLPNNKTQAYNMFLRTKKRLDRDLDLFNEYDAFMQSMIDNDYMEIVPTNELHTNPGLSWYLTHHAVRHKQKGKLRVVFNCSLKCNDVSLNDRLLQGPDLINNLYGVLLRFREEMIGVVGDIRSMFYRVKVPKRHRDFLRFFWFDSERRSIVAYRLKVHVFGATSSPSVANFALKQTALDSIVEPGVRDAIMRNFYVDDFLASSKSSADAVHLLSQVRDTVASGGFELVSFNSNSEEVLSSLREVNSPKDVKQPLILSNPNSKALGVTWNMAEDLFTYTIKLDEKLSQSPCTKRSVLKTVASVYDPLGICSPVIVVGRKIFQESCRLKCDWDEELPEHIRDSWKNWLRDVKDLESFSVPRCLKLLSDHDNVTLHIFTDGSETAYGAVAYLEFSYKDDQRESSSILSSKSRLTPICNRTLKTVPRIEMCGAKLGVDLAQKIVSESTFSFIAVRYWCDSQTVLKYIKNEESRFQRFIANKVSFIRSHSNPDQWYYVPSKLNPADLISRGTSVANLRESRLWNYGPAYLTNNDLMPYQIFDAKIVDDDPEIKSEFKTLKTEVKANNPLDQVMESVSEWHKLKIRIGWLLKLKHALVNKISLAGEKLSVEDLSNSETAIIKYDQCKFFSDIIECLSNNKSILKSSNLRKLNPFLDKNGLLRVGGRLSNLDKASYSVKYPIIMSNKSRISELIIESAHSSLGHLGRETVLCKLRRRYHVIGGNSLVRKILNSCISCRKLQSKPLEQIMGELPSDRVTSDIPAFTKVGIDYFGPFYVSYFRKSQKRYGVIFSCMSSRALHLEVAHSLTTDSFINALRRFICRRGNVTHVTSDNGTNLASGNRELKEEISKWNLNVIEGWLKQKGIQWSFSPPTGSHFNGFVEREVRSVRKVLTSIMSSQNVKLNDEDLSTLFCEVESVLNNRPLTELSSDACCDEPLTPNHLLLFNAGVTFPPGLFEKGDDYLKRRWKQIQYLVGLFWSRWRKQYVILLNQRQKWCFPKRSLKVGDLVVVIDINLCRNQWPIGRVVNIKADKLGRVRSVHVKISKCKNSNLRDFSTNVIERPVAKLVLLLSVDE